MPLTFDLTRCVKTEELLGAVRTEAMVFATITTGMNVVTAENYREFFIRINVYERALGAFVTQKEGDVKIEYPFTLGDVRRYIGLQTNSTPKTLRQWNGDMIRILRERSHKEASE